ncbi:MAG: DUF983 domain-containing protein [Myxococcota bacterium]
MDPYRLAVSLNRCPVCGKGALFKGWLTLHETCEVCGSRYFRDPGNWTAPTAFGYGIGAASAVITMLVLWQFDLCFEGSEYIIVAVAIGMTLATFRHVKAWWVAVLTSMGHVYPDPVEE